MSDPLLEGRQLVGAPVVDLTTGDDLAEVRDVVFNAKTGALVGFTLNKRAGGWWSRLTAGRMREVLDIRQVAAVGAHAVMVRGREAMVEPADSTDPTAGVDPGRDEVTDDRVVTESGRELGRVTDVIIQGGRAPRVVGYRIAEGVAGEGFIPLHEQTAVSGRALIVPDEFEGRLRQDMPGLASELLALQEVGR